MGGYFSTRWNWEHTWQDTVGLLRLDARHMKRTGVLQPGTLATSHWTRGDGAPAATITTYFDGDTLTLDYRTQRYGETAWTLVRDRVPLDTTPCTFGGERVWFRCPGCQRRRAVPVYRLP